MSTEPQAAKTGLSPQMSRSGLVPSATVKPLTAEQRQRLGDAAWAEEDPLVIASYPGEFVVPHAKQIVAHGRDIQAVLEQAAGKTGRRSKS